MKTNISIQVFLPSAVSSANSALSAMKKTNLPVFWNSGSLGIPILPCAFEISICQTVWWLWPVSFARICENVISNHRTRWDGKTLTRTMRQTEACSSFVWIQHGCSRSEALFQCSCGSPFSPQVVIYRRFVTPLDV